jgi:hypothetical protein
MSDDVTMHPDGSVTIDINLDRHPHLSVLLLARTAGGQPATGLLSGYPLPISHRSFHWFALYVPDSTVDVCVSSEHLITSSVTKTAWTEACQASCSITIIW